MRVAAPPHRQHRTSPNLIMRQVDPGPRILRAHRPKAVVSDIDGTITTLPHHNPAGDVPVPQMIRLLRQVKAKGYKVVVLTARKAHEKPMTYRWLRQQGVPFDLLITRDVGDEESPALYKLHAFRRLIEPYFRVDFALDDKANCWHYLGIHRPFINRVRSLGVDAYRHMA